MKSSYLCFLLMAVVATSCATKKFVRQEVETASSNVRAELNKKIEANQASINALESQLGELQKLSSENKSRIEMVANEADQKFEAAKRVGAQAQESADKAMSHAQSVEQMLLNRNNYEIKSTAEVYFDFNKWALKDEERQKLEPIARALKENRDLVVELQGHTDAIGDAEYNLMLSQKRVDSVVRYLVAEHDVPLRKIFKLGLGEDKPVADNKTREGRKQNRRVTIRLLEPKLAAGVALAR